MLYWICGLLCVVSLLGCVPHPVYCSRGARPDPKGRPSARAPEETRSNRRPPTIVPPAPAARPVDPAEIDTGKAYQIGTASYYGKKFHGRRTANGEVFNMYKLTAAHRVLPLGTTVKVTHLGNGRWVEVKVNDRGPFVEGRILDLSLAAALKLEMVRAGTADVMIEITSPLK